MSIVAVVVVVVVKNSDAQHYVINGYRLGQIQREQHDIVLVPGELTPFSLEAGEEVLGEVEGPVRVVTLAADESVNGVPVQRAELSSASWACGVAGAAAWTIRLQRVDGNKPVAGPSGVKPGCIGALLGR